MNDNNLYEEENMILNIDINNCKNDLYNYNIKNNKLNFTIYNIC